MGMKVAEAVGRLLEGRASDGRAFMDDSPRSTA